MKWPPDIFLPRSMRGVDHIAWQGGHLLWKGGHISWGCPVTHTTGNSCTNALTLTGSAGGLCSGGYTVGTINFAPNVLVIPNSVDVVFSSSSSGAYPGDCCAAMNGAFNLAFNSPSFTNGCTGAVSIPTACDTNQSPAIAAYIMQVGANYYWILYGTYSISTAALPPYQFDYWQATAAIPVSGGQVNPIGNWTFVHSCNFHYGTGDPCTFGTPTLSVI